MPKQIEDLRGKRFGRWTVVELAPRLAKPVCWVCRCDCGQVRTCQRASLINGRSASCGCRSRELAAERFRTHGDTVDQRNSRVKGTKEYTAWKDAKGRCHNPNHRWYPAYGAKGVIVCEGWRGDYSAFLSDMGRAPDGHSLDRIDAAGNYEPGNCRWADKRTQAINTRKGVTEIAVDGVMFTTKELARAYGVGSTALRRRLRLGEDPAEAIRHIQAQRPNRRHPATP